MGLGLDTKGRAELQTGAGMYDAAKAYTYFAVLQCNLLGGTLPDRSTPALGAPNACSVLWLAAIPIVPCTALWHGSALFPPCDLLMVGDVFKCCPLNPMTRTVMTLCHTLHT